MSSHLSTTKTITIFAVIPLLLYANKANALLIILPTVGVASINILASVLLFVFVPTALLGILRSLLGFYKTGQGKWKFSVKESMIQIIKMFAYNTAMVIIWIYFAYDRTLYDVPWKDSAFYFPVLFLYIILWALIAPYVLLLISKVNKVQSFRPSLGLHLRMTLWNAFIFILLSLYTYYIL